MAINMNQYVDIVSGVGVGTVVPRRELIGRLFTTNPLLPPGTYAQEFTSASEVGTYYGTDSEEYKRAVLYFSWVSKNITRPKRISFSRWVDVAVAPKIFGDVKTQTLATYTAISNGSFKMTISGVQTTFTAIDFSGAASLAAVAAILETALQTGSGTMYTSSDVVWNTARGSFDFTGGSAVATTDISVQAGTTGTDISDLIGWLSGARLITANGAAIQTITQTLDASSEASNNFGSFLFIPAFTLDQTTEAAVWTAAQNVMFQYMVPVSIANRSTWSAALIGYAGVGITLSPLSTEYPEMAPMIIMAATNYSAQNSVQNYEFQDFPTLTASVSTTDDAVLYNTLRINYIGVTQTAGVFLSFYQQGVLCGGATAPQDMNVFANEQWLKTEAQAAFMTLLLALPKVSANAQGRSQLMGTLQTVVDQALNNGTISVGKLLTNDQKLYISELTGDSNAWHQVQNSGYWYNVVIELNTGTGKYEAYYTLVYSKDDVIRKVNGTHVLI